MMIARDGADRPAGAATATLPVATVDTGERLWHTINFAVFGVELGDAVVDLVDRADDPVDLSVEVSVSVGGVMGGGVILRGIH